MIKKALNYKCIELLQMGWYMANTKIRIRLDHNQPIVSMLEYPNLSKILDNHVVDLIKDKFNAPIR